MFVRFEDENYASVYIKIESITAIFYDYSEHSTAIDFDNGNSIFVREDVDDVVEKIFKKLNKY